MRVSAEIWFLTNFLMDAILFAAVSRGPGRLRARRILAAALAGGLGATVVALPCWRGLRLLSLPLAVSAAGLSLAWIVGKGRFAVRGSLLFLAGAALLRGLLALLGGEMRLPRPWSLLAGAGAGGLVLAWLLGQRARSPARLEVRVEAETRWGRACFAALVDTGNQLREPLSGLPVLVVEARLLRPLLPEALQTALDAGEAPRGFRVVGYHSLGGEGRMLCFRPDRLRYGTGERLRPAPDVWIAVYPGRLPGPARALAPPCFGAMETDA